MRKALILFLAATAMTPFAAHAQEADAGQEAESQQIPARYERLEQRNQQRYEQRQARQQARQQRQAERVQRVDTPSPVATTQRQRVRDYGGDGAGERRNRDLGGDGTRTRRFRDLRSTDGWAGPTNDPSLRDEADRYDRLARENALRYGTREQRQEIREERRDWRQDRREDRRDDRRDWRQDRREDRRDWRQDRRADRRDWRRDWNRTSWRSDYRYNWQDYRYRNRNIFRLSPYYSPYRNHRYSRFSIGFFLDSLFYDRRYWIGDPWQYRLPAAPYGTQWVRYYDDVLLVDVYTGEVVDVIYDFFW